MAVGIDLGFVSLELSQLATVSDRVRCEISRFARPAIGGTLAGSAAMNAFAFAAQADGYVMMCAAITLGVAIPALAVRWFDWRQEGDRRACPVLHGDGR
jgi:hypothetical protein